MKRTRDLQKFLKKKDLQKKYFKNQFSRVPFQYNIGALIEKKTDFSLIFFPPVAVLTYHAAGDTIFSAALDDGDAVSTLQGDDIVIVIDDNGNIFLFFNCFCNWHMNETYNLLHNIVIVIAKGIHPVLLLIVVS